MRKWWRGSTANFCTHHFMYIKYESERTENKPTLGDGHDLAPELNSIGLLFLEFGVLFLGVLHLAILGEDNQLAHVLLQPLDVQLQTLHGLIPRILFIKNAAFNRFRTLDGKKLILAKPSKSFLTAKIR